MTRSRAKISITIDEELLARVRVAVGAGHAKSVSAYVEQAVACQLAAQDDFGAMLAESLAATGGPLSDEERASARRILTGVVPLAEASSA